MNIYIVVEGEIGERKVYEHWIPLVNPCLSFVNTPDKAVMDNFYIIAGGGYPNIFQTIEDAMLDLRTYNQYDRFVVALDSELQTRDEKELEIKEFIDSIGCRVEYRIVVQHFCLETWAIGNKKIFPRNIKDPKLREYQNFYNVLIENPELLPPYKNSGLNRAQFCYSYLRLLLQHKHHNLSYTKSNPGPLLHDKYFEQVKKRYSETGHIESFGSFLTAFV